MNLNDIIKLRRNVKPKLFTGDLIPDAIVTEILSTANWAPTHGYTEPWRFVVFSGASLKRLAEFQAELYKSSTSVELYKELKYTKLKSTPLLASHIIALVVHKSINTPIPLVEEIAATSCGVQNILLSAASKNIAVHWTSGGMTYNPEMKTYLGFDAKDQVLGFLYLGISPTEVNKEGRRLSSIDEKITWMK
tara:strand:+ start:1265 stop:1840 length:576 start_codon:yes stop_codon:yes gene_type:complete